MLKYNFYFYKFLIILFLSLLLDFIATKFLDFILISCIFLSRYYALYILYISFNSYNGIEKIFYNCTIYIKEKNSITNNKDYKITKKQIRIAELKLDTK